MSEREQFEKWITSSPFEKSIKRNSEREVWPGQYQNIDVQLAWEAWQDRADIAEQRIRELTEALERYRGQVDRHGNHSAANALDAAKKPPQ